MVASISLWPPGRRYCLTVTALRGVGNTCGGCLAYPLMTAFTARTGDGIPPQRSTAQDLARFLSPKYIPELGTCTQCTLAQKVTQFPMSRTQPLLQCFGHHSHQYMHCGQETVLVCQVPGCIQHRCQPGPLLFVHWLVTRELQVSQGASSPHLGSLGRHLGLSPIQNGTGHQQRHLQLA